MVATIIRQVRTIATPAVCCHRFKLVRVTFTLFPVSSFSIVYPTDIRLDYPCRSKQLFGHRRAGHFRALFCVPLVIGRFLSRILDFRPMAKQESELIPITRSTSAVRSQCSSNKNAHLILSQHAAPVKEKSGSRVSSSGVSAGVR